MIFSLKWIAIASVASFLLGSINGVYLSNKYHNYSAMQATIKALKIANKRYRDAVGVSKDIDEKTSDVELDNETIMSAIAAKIEEAAKKKGTTNVCQPEGPTAPKSDVPAISDECIPASVLRAIGDLK